MAIEFTVFKGSSEGQIIESKTTISDISANDVVLEHTHSGVCGTDAHYRNSEMVLGHEGVGVVRAVGEKVQNFKIGDRVGFGYSKGGCGECQYCQTGHTWHCTDAGRNFALADLDQGSFATKSVWPDTRLVKLPDEIASEHAGPFMCAGQTVFIPLLRNGAKASDNVGVVGIGGLGHLAIQFAAALGCKVAVFSSSDSKRQEALALGATEFYNMKDLKGVVIPVKLDHLIVTTSMKPDWELYTDLMAPFGHIYPLTIGGGNLEFPYLPLILKELSIHGSCSSNPEEVNKMLDFIVAHDIKPVIQKFPMSVEGITEAFAKLNSGEIRYRGVLEV